MQTHGLLTLTASSSPLLYKKIVVHIHRRGYYTTNLSMFDREPKNPEQPISRYQAFRIVQEYGDLIGLKLSPNSLRKTFGYIHYKRTNDVSLLMKVFNHSSPAVTLYYIGFDEETMQNEIYNHYI